MVLLQRSGKTESSVMQLATCTVKLLVLLLVLGLSLTVATNGQTARSSKGEKIDSTAEQMPQRTISLHSVAEGSHRRPRNAFNSVQNTYPRTPYISFSDTNYVEIIKENIQPGMLRHFEKLTRAEVDSLGEEYDYSSIMHFRRDAFAKPGTNETIRPKQCCPRPVIGEATQPSAGDFRQVNKLYKCPFVCGESLKADKGAFTSPGYPSNYLPNKQCIWKIEVSAGFAVVLSFVTFGLEEQSDCSYNHLEIFDGPSEDSPILRKLCGLDIPATIRSTSNRVTVRFTTDSVLGSQRFAASFEKVSPEQIGLCGTTNHGCEHICVNIPGGYKCRCHRGYNLHPNGKTCTADCGGVVYGTRGTLSTPFHPENYRPNQDCTWNITAPSNHIILFTFTKFDLQDGSGKTCLSDFVRVYSVSAQNTTRINTFCGQKRPQSLISHSSELRVVFHSDGHLERTGFRAAFYTYVNNCIVSNGGCQHICESGIPKHKCKCRSGYKLQNVSECKKDCGYKKIKADNFEHAMLVQQLIVGLRDEKARENLLSEKKDLSWEKACDIASHQERVRQNLQQLNQSNDGVIASLESEMAVSLVNTAVSSPRQRPSAPSKQLLSCYRCGQHHIRCPAGDGEAILRMFPANATLQSPYTITLPVDHHPVKFEIGTGSAVTLINEASLQKVPFLLPASSTFRSYTGQNVDVRGVFTAEVEHDGELHYLPVHVVRGSQQPNLLGRNWIKCVPSVLSYVHRIGVNPALDSILVNHKDLFRDDSATHYRGPPVKFQFQSDFRPRFFKARTVTYALAPKVEEELDRLQKADIIEPVQYSEWAAPIVPVLKTDGSVRICGDYKLTINSATKLNPYPLPRIEDLYRITPNDSTGASPAELMFKRQLRTRLDLLNPSTQDRVIAKQTKMKERYDVSTRPRVVAPNENVYTRLEHETNWCPAVVRKSEGQIVELELEGERIVRRHLDQVRSRTDTVSGEFGELELPANLDRDPDIPRTEPLLPAQGTTPSTEAYVPPPSTPASTSLGAEEPVTTQSGAEVENTALRRSTRNCKPVQRFQDESY
nr:unnamed protein product [Spirometra erinaceieuropaei]